MTRRVHADARAPRHGEPVTERVRGLPGAKREACESGKAGAKYDAVIAKFVAFGCGGCGIANAPGLRTSAESFLDTKNGQVYCAGSTPF